MPQMAPMMWLNLFLFFLLCFLIFIILNYFNFLKKIKFKNDNMNLMMNSMNWKW